MSDHLDTLSCGGCGELVPAGSRFCPACGFGLNVTQSEGPSRRPSGMGGDPTMAAGSRDPARVEGRGAAPAAASASDSQRPPVAAAAQPAADPLIGQVIAGRYRILSMLGRGGMGVVYKVEHIHIGKIMAMKLLSGELASDASTVKRFRREAKAVSRLTHANTVQIFDFGEDARMAYLVMEYLPGRDFADVVGHEAPLDFARVARVAAQVASSVGEAHAQGVVHRDIKPENVFVVDGKGPTDFVKVLDFGIAKLRDQEDVGSVTMAGNLVGTPYYMAPEQIRAEEIDHRVDVYALGAMMYKACTGVPPFVAETSLGILTAHLNDSLIPLGIRTGTPVPEAAERIIAKSLAKRREDRFQTMEEVREELVAYLRSVGELAPDPNASGALSTSGLQAAGAGEVATRSDVDGYERRLRRTSVASWISLLVLLALVAGGSYYAWTQRPVEVVSAEVEPNDSPATANALQLGHPLTAHLGQRTTPTASDADVFAFEIPRGSDGTAHVEVSALPNMDIVVDIIRKGEVTPLRVGDSGRRGEPEVFPNLGLRPGHYFVRVQEVPVAGQMATENISDTYSIAVRQEALREGFEREPNDTHATAAALPSRASVQGLLGWADDEDVYCIESVADPTQIEVSGLPNIDLALALHDGHGGPTRIHNAGAPGEGEQLLVGAEHVGRAFCFGVRVAPPPPVLPAEDSRPGEALGRADAQQPYIVRLSDPPVSGEPAR